MRSIRSLSKAASSAALAAKTKKTVRRRKKLSPEEVEARARETLFDLMVGSANECLRLAAAKFFLGDTLGKKRNAQTKHETEAEQNAAFNEAQELLDSFVAAKASCVSRAGAVDQDGKA